MKYCITYLLLILIVSSCGKNSPGPNIENTIVSIESDHLSYNVGETIQVKVTIKKMDVPVFGFYCNIYYDSVKLNFDDSADLGTGDFFSDNAISFSHDHETTITVTITSIQGETGVTGNGIAFILTFEAITPGQTMLEFEPDELDFYDASGSIVSIGNMELQSLTISIN